MNVQNKNSSYFTIFLLWALCICSPGTSAITEQVRISADNDDAEELISDGDMYRDSTDLEFSHDDFAGGLQIVGMRFKSVDVPQGATINSAYLEFTTDEKDTGTTKLVIYGEDHDNPNQFANNNYNISKRTKTSALVNWTPSVWNNTNLIHQSSDIKTIIQEIVNRTGWQSNNNLVLIVEPGSGCTDRNCQRTAESHDGESNNAPLLIINYSLSSNNPTVVSQITSDTTPVISGTYSSSTATSLSVTVNSVIYTLSTNSELTNSGDNWTLNLNNIIPLSLGTYDVIATSISGSGALSDTSNNELVIQAINLCTNTSDAWWDENWANRMEIVFDNSASSEQLSSFPVLVSLTENDISFSDTQNNGADIRFIDSNGSTLLDYEIEKWDKTSGSATIWVNVPVISSGSDTDYIMMYYNNPNISSSINTDPWKTNYAGVWHLNETSGNTSADATSNNNDGTWKKNPVAGSGKIAGGLDTRTKKSFVEIPKDSSIDLTKFNNWTISGWVKPTILTGDVKWPLIYSYGSYRVSLGLAAHSAADGLIENWTNDSNALHGNTQAPLNKWSYVAITRNASTTTLYLNGTVDGGGSSTTVTQSNQKSYIGGNGDNKNDLRGYLDEIRVATVARSADWIEAQYKSQNNTFNSYCVEAQPITPIGPDHYAITHNAIGVTCEASLVTITAHDDSHNPVNVGNNIDLTISTTPVVDNIITSPLTLPADESSVSFYLNQSSPMSNIDINVTDGSATDLGDSGLEDPVISFLDAAFLFYSDGNSTTPIGSQIAGKPSDTSPSDQVLTLRAVSTNTDGACKAALQGTSNVKFAYKCNNPNTCTSSDLLYVTGASSAKAVSHNNNNATIDYTEVSLTFDSNGIAPFKFHYDDAGQITLHAKKDVIANNPNPAFTLTGSSAPFVVRPFGFYLDVKDNPGAIDHLEEKFKKAGENFTTTVTAIQWQSNGDVDLSNNPVTSNFGNESTAESATIIHNMNSPDLNTAPNAGVLGNLSNTNFSFINGVSSNTKMTYSEVGIINFEAHLTDNSYLATDDVVGEVLNIGRFTPDHFVLENKYAGTLSGGNPFVYSGQMSLIAPLQGQLSYSPQPEFTITAESLSGSTTKNYTGNFIKLDAQSIHNVISSNNSTGNSVGLTGNLVIGSLDDEGDGILTYQFNSDDNYFYIRDIDALIAPFDATIDLQVTSLKDSDLVSADSDLTLQPDTNGIKVRFGRWIMENSYGPETIALRVPMQVQFWDGNNFVSKNASYTGDSFTTFDTSVSPSPFTITNVSLAPATTIASGSGTFNNGETNLFMLSSPGANNQGAVKVKYDVPTWLKYDWTVSDGSYDENPNALATFGLFRGNDRIIYRQEVFE
jgi:hypothetical protein